MTLKELPSDVGPYRSTILGTDISDTALAQASYGCYNKVEMAVDCPQTESPAIFRPWARSGAFKDELRALGSFRKLNLLESFAGLAL